MINLVYIKDAYLPLFEEHEMGMNAIAGVPERRFSGRYLAESG